MLVERRSCILKINRNMLFKCDFKANILFINFNIKEDSFKKLKNTIKKSILFSKVRVIRGKQ